MKRSWSTLTTRLQRISQQKGDTWDEKLTALRECLAALAAAPRQVISMRYLEGCTAEQISETLEVTREAIGNDCSGDRRNCSPVCNVKAFFWDPIHRRRAWRFADAA